MIVTIRVRAFAGKHLAMYRDSSSIHQQSYLFQNGSMLWSSKSDLDDDLSNIMSKEKKHIFIFLILGNFFRERAFILMVIIRL